MSATAPTYSADYWHGGWELRVTSTNHLLGDLNFDWTGSDLLLASPSQAATAAAAAIQANPDGVVVTVGPPDAHWDHVPDGDEIAAIRAGLKRLRVDPRLVRHPECGDPECDDLECYEFGTLR